MIQETFLLQNPWRTNPDHQFYLKDRNILDILKKNMENELLIGLIGSRQVGKSSLLRLLISHLLNKGVSSGNIFYFNLDDIQLQSLFRNVAEFLQFTGKNHNKKYIFIDEIQRLESPGLFLKEVYDLNLNLKIIYSGSSQLEIKAKTKEHLVGRARVFNINRLNFDEYLAFASPITKQEALNQILLYGSYPSVAKEKDQLEKKLRIKDIFQSYVQKDLIDFLNLRETDSYNKFLGRIAMQTGNLLNIESICRSIKIPRTKVEEYLNVLEHTFICKKIHPFYRNYNKEITKTPKYYFLDLGLRNFILNNFQNLELRQDRGSLFENFFLTELVSNDFYSMNKINFWRTTNKTEIDFIVHTEGDIRAFEVKWSNNRTPRSFETIRSVYPEINCSVVTKDRYIKESKS